MGKYQIYISYRRNGGENVAALLYNTLSSLGYAVYFDTESLHHGAFQSQTDEALQSCQDFLLILSPHALDLCATRDDWMRREIEQAISHQKNIIPIMMHGFEYPKSLPRPLESLRLINGAMIYMEFWSASVDRIEKMLTTQKSHPATFSVSSGKTPSKSSVKPYRGDKKFIFISYAHKDSPRVFPIISYLHHHGYRIWYDEGIDPGTEWDKEIAEHIVSCGYFIAFISQNYLDSSNCKDELNFARDLEKNRFLVYIEQVQLPVEMQMRMSRIQNIHKYTYADEESFFDKLLQANRFHEYRE